jgi:hypothetical protein
VEGIEAFQSGAAFLVVGGYGNGLKQLPLREGLSLGFHEVFCLLWFRR